VLLGGREDVEDAAADGELAALLDQLDARVGDVDQPAHDVVEPAVDVLALAQLHRLEVAEARHLRLQHAAHGGDDDVERAGGGVVVARVRQPAQHRQPAPDRVGARAEPLVGQRLPARVDRDAGGVEQAAQRADQVLGLAPGGGDGEHRAPRAHQAGDRERAHPGGRGEVEAGRLGAGEGLRERGVVEDDVEQAGQRHGTPGATQKGPARPRAGGWGATAASGRGAPPG
jgi:hypothetical protein